MTRSLEDGLKGLAEKYRILARLRVRREEAEAAGLKAFPPGESAERAGEFKRIAERFPGALRELERTPSGILSMKARTVERELDDLRRHPGKRRPSRHWVAIVLDYHASLREALEAKSWLAANVQSGGKITAEVVRAFRSSRREEAAGSSAEAVGAEFLRRVQSPPAGRLQSLVWRELEERHGVGRRALQQAVYGVPSDIEDDAPGPD